MSVPDSDLCPDEVDSADATDPAENEVEEPESQEFYLGQGRANVTLEAPCSYRKVYRLGQDSNTQLMILAIDVLFEEGHLSLSEALILEAYEHWTYDEYERAAIESLNMDQDEGFKAVLERAIIRLFAGALPTWMVFEQQLVDCIRRYRFAVSTLLRAGIMSYRFGVYMYNEYRRRKQFLYAQFETWFAEGVRRSLMQRCSIKGDLWLLFGLERQVTLFRRRFEPTLQPDHLERLALLSVSAYDLQYACPLGLEQVLLLFFGARLVPDPNCPQSILCYPPN